MLKHVILPSTTIENWNDSIRPELVSRIEATFGTMDIPSVRVEPMFEMLDTYEEGGLIHHKIRYHVIDDEWNEGIFILPAQIKENKKARAILAIHGTTRQGKYGVIKPSAPQNRGYATELAHRGYVTFSVDQYGFGTLFEGVDKSEWADRFYLKYPHWSLDGRRLWEQRKALDVMEQMDFILDNAFGVMGNSLGGRAVAFLAAFDERIKAAVGSTAISPNATNQFRYLNGKGRKSNPVLADAMGGTGKPPWEYQELLSLCAPRAYLALEPFNDAYNPYVSPVMDCLYKASEVYSLSDCPDRLAWLIHGDGHDTIDSVREFAYTWLDRFLRD